MIKHTSYKWTDTQSFCGIEYDDEHSYENDGSWKDATCLKCLEFIMNNKNTHGSYTEPSVMETVEKNYKNLLYNNDFDKLIKE